MEDVYYLPPGAGEDIYFATNPFDKDYILGVDEADGQSFSGEFTLNLADGEGFDELLLEILYGDRIRKTIERLNDEWLEKMWKVSCEDLLVFRFEQIRERFEKAQEVQDKIHDNWDRIRTTRFIKW